jgi:hypothetical protein
MKNKVKRLIELLENNMTSLWNDNLEHKSECVVVENNDILKLIEEVKKDLNNTQ